jgi:hypothetical protein
MSIPEPDMQGESKAAQVGHEREFVGYFLRKNISCKGVF